MERAADALWVLTSFEAFDRLYAGRGLDTEASADLLIEMARSTLLARGWTEPSDRVEAAAAGRREGHQHPR